MSVAALGPALQASGGALALVDAVVEASQGRSPAGEVPAGYSIARPPGHHATADQSMGFCLFNNVAIAARYAQQRHGLKKVGRGFAQCLAQMVPLEAVHGKYSSVVQMWMSYDLLSHVLHICPEHLQHVLLMLSSTCPLTKTLCAVSAE